MGCGSSSGKVDEATLAFLSQVPLFRRLPQEEHAKLAQCSQTVDKKPGQCVVRQGDEGDELFIIKSGTATVIVDGKKVALLKSGDFFGEAALLHDAPRNATITAASPLQCIRVGRKEFQSMGLNEKLDFAKRAAVCGAAGRASGEVESQPPSTKTPLERKLMTNAIQGNQNLQLAFGNMLDVAKISKLVDIAWRENVKANQKLISAGDINADYFYIVHEGAFKVIPQSARLSAEQAVRNAKVDDTLPPGSSFGELALLYFSPRRADVIAEVDSVVWVIDRINFREVLSEYFDKRINEYVRLLESNEALVAQLGSRPKQERIKFAQALTEMTFERGDKIFEQGDKGDAFYILVEGKVTVLQDGEEVQQLEAPKPQYFGEAALIEKAPRNATIQVVSKQAKTLTMDAVSFNVLMGFEDLPQATKAKRYGTIKKSDLKQLGLLGCGGFGAVYMVQHQKTRGTYALKLLSKGYVVKAGMQKSVTSEKNVQMLCDSPFVVKLYETFNSQQNLELLLELALGGELYATYNKKSLWGSVDHARFYIAGTVFAFEHLHSRKIIFRDLKPENLLLNELGHVKLTDMGLAKVVLGTTYTTCGTPIYFAPEIVTSGGHTKAVDWWTLGVLTFELLAGHPPFEGASDMETCKLISRGINKVDFPKACRGAAESFIKGLCAANPSDRPPMGKDGTAPIKSHGWFSGFKWSDMEHLKLDPPYKPAVKSRTDESNFNASTEDLPPQFPYRDDGSGWDKDFATST